MPNNLSLETTIPAILRLLRGLGIETNRTPTPTQTPSPGATKMVTIPTIRRRTIPTEVPRMPVRRPSPYETIPGIGEVRIISRMPVRRVRTPGEIYR